MIPYGAPEFTYDDSLRSTWVHIRWFFTEHLSSPTMILYGAPEFTYDDSLRSNWVHLRWFLTEHLRSPTMFSGVHVAQSLAFCAVYFRSWFVIFDLTIDLLVLRSDYCFGIFKLFVLFNKYTSKISLHRENYFTWSAFELFRPSSSW
jgi:truncated hemoglobin YjbI